MLFPQVNFYAVGDISQSLFLWTTDMSLSRITIIIGICIVTIFRCFYFDWHRPVEKWDEKTNISVIEESKIGSNFLMLWNKSTPFFEKPPVWYYLGKVISNHLSHPTEVSLRLSSALFGSVLLLIVFFFAYKTWGVFSGMLAWGILISTNHLFTSNISGIFSTHTLQSADADSLFVLLIVCSSFLSLRLSTSYINAIFAGLIAGLAILTKSPIGCIPLVCEYCIEYRFTKNRINMNRILLALSAMLFVFFSWVVIMYSNFGILFISEYFGYHIASRVLFPLESHVESPFFYISILFTKNIFLCMELYVLSGFLILQSKKIFKDRFLLHVFIVSLSFLIIPTLMQTKLSWYIFPFYPFAALTIAGVASHFIVFSRFSGKRV